MRSDSRSNRTSTLRLVGANPLFLLLSSVVAFTALVPLCDAASVEKRGLLFPWDSKSEDLSSGGFTKAACPKASFANNWESWVPGGLDPALEFIALARTSSDLPAVANFMQTNGAAKFAFLNEPDLDHATTLDFNTAAQLWDQYALPLRDAKGTYLISPAVTSDESKGIPWLDGFFGLVSSSMPDALGLHYYGDSAAACITYLTMMHNRYNQMDVWVTEVASTSTDPAAVMDFMRDVMAWADSTAWVKGIFWFCASRTANTDTNLATSALMAPDGTRTALGDYYCTDSTSAPTSLPSTTKAFGGAAPAMDTALALIALSVTAVALLSF